MPKLVDHAQRRQEISAAVWEIIATDGLAAVTLRAIAARAGISMGRVQHYFPSREAIVLQGLTALLAAAADVYDPPPESPASALRLLLTQAIPRTEAQRLGSKVWYVYLSEAVTDSAIAEVVRGVLQGNEDRATDLLDGDRSYARLLLAAADGYAYRALVGQLSAQDAHSSVVALLTAHESAN